MSLAAREHPLLVGDGFGGFIFPRFHPSFDGLFATVRLIELLVAMKQTLGEVMDQTPPVHLARLQVVCPWEEKGRVMRMLAQDPQTERTRQIDGVKHQNDGEWILVLPGRRPGRSSTCTPRRRRRPGMDARPRVRRQARADAHDLSVRIAIAQCAPALAR